MALAGVAPAGAFATSTKSEKILGVSVPASAQIHGTTTGTPTTTTQAQATTTQAQTATTPATTTPAGGAQPGTVAPGASATTTTPTTGTPPPTAQSTTPGTTTTTGGSKAVVGVAHKASPSHTRLSTGALALAVLGCLLILGCLTWVVGHWLALEPRWTTSFMHALREATYRASATWAEFSDWARLGH
jgi:hypothetical protein